ncbi:hypothetical protein IW16_22350 [Chryseobacterium vrystaatense]|uniref:Uncharacterized protein n=1 Tax=Chryseobacterium vrystaatense TaxID=307480 RepID=A0ABR4UHM1_9FLAO|nr:hypothetical protein IW16_22350 [Chryseobacterium vrystaatense]
MYNAQDTKEIAKQRAKLVLFDEEKVNNTNSKYLGKIVFANSEIKENDPESKYISSYTFGDKLFIRSFLANSIGNNILIQMVEKGIKAKVINDRGSEMVTANIIYKLYIDGKEVSKTKDGSLYDEYVLHSLNINSCINDGTNTELFGEELYTDLLNHPELLTPGNHKMKIEMIPVCPRCSDNSKPEKILAVGEIDMVIPNTIKVIESDCFPKKQWSDPKLENEVLKAFKKRTDAYKVILTDKDYTVVKNEYGIVLRKGFIAAVVFKNGNDVSYEYLNFERVFDGMNFQSLQIADMTSIPGRIPSKGKKVNASCLKYLK